MSDAVMEPQSPFKETAVRSENRNIPNLYWRKGPNEPTAGWIIVGPGLETAQGKRWRDKGREPLIDYSYTDRTSPKTGARETIEYTADGLSRFRYYWFFKNGGAKEFSVEQIVAHNWHINPPYGLSVEAFPQLAEWVLPEPLWCPICPPSAPNKNSPAQLIQHGMIGHKLGLAEARELLKDARTPPTAGGLSPVIRRKSEMTPEAIAEREEFGKKMVAVAEAEGVGNPTTGNLLQICNNCGGQIVGKLADHVCA